MNIWATDPIYEKNGIIYIDVERLGLFGTEIRTGDWRFEFQGVTYYYDPDNADPFHKLIRDPRTGILRQEVVTNIFIQESLRLPSFGLPSGVASKPREVWLRPSNSGGLLSLHVEQQRWLRTTVYLDDDPVQIDIPLIDDDDRPWLDPTIPPITSIRRHTTGGEDLVGNPGQTNKVWTDYHIGFRLNADLFNAPYYPVQWSLVQKRDPRLHWVLRISATRSSSSNFDTTLMIDMIGNGYGVHNSTSREEGSSGASGHWKSELMWTQVDWDTSPDRTVANERVYTVGSIQVVNDPTLATTTTLYFTDGANQGLVTGDDVFSDLPMCIVYGNATLNTDVTGGSNWANWEPESWGMGLHDIKSDAPHSTKLYYSNLLYDGTDYKVHIFNTSDDGTTTPNAALDRTFFAYCWGID